MVLKRAPNLWTIEIFEDKELNLCVLALIQKKARIFFFTRVSKVSFRCKGIGKNQESKASLTFKRLQCAREEKCCNFVSSSHMILCSNYMDIHTCAFEED